MAKIPLDTEGKQQELLSFWCDENRGCVTRTKIAVGRHLPPGQSKELEVTELNRA